MVDDARDDDLRRRLHRTAPTPTRSPDLDRIRRGIGRRRLARRGVAGLAALVVASGLAVAALDQNRTDDVSEVEVVDEPGTTVPPEAEDEGGDDTAPDHLESLGALGAEGIAIQTEAGVELRALDGSLLHTIAGYDLATEDRADGLMSTVTNVVPLRAPDGSLHWFDPASGLVTTVGPDGGAPLWNGAQVAVHPERGVRAVGTGSVAERDWTRTDEWWLSSGHRSATVVGEGYFDSAVPGVRLLAPSCWVAAQATDRDVLICRDGDDHRVSHHVNGRGDTVAVPDGTDGEPRRVTAAWLVGDDVLVRTEQATCLVADGMVLRGGELVPLLGPDATGLPSSAPIGVAADGRAIVHLNAAACDAAAADMGVHLVDVETGEREQVWEGAALPWEVRAWTTLPLAADDVASPEEPTGVDHIVPLAEPLTPEEIGRDLLVFGTDGISRIVDGEREQLWPNPVDQAFEDGSGGLLFVAGGVWRLPWASTSATQWINYRGQPRIWAVGDIEGEAAAWITTLPTDMTETGPTVLPETEQTLAAWLLDGGDVVDIGVTGDGRETGLDGVALLPEERVLVSTCHLQCRIREGLGSDDEIVAGWVGGLDGSSTGWAYVQFGPPGPEGQATTPVLVVRGLDHAVVAEVPLPEEIGWLTHVDLSDDGSAALVWSSDYEDGLLAAGPVYVTGLDTAEPRVHPVETDQSLRFS